MATEHTTDQHRSQPFIDNLVRAFPEPIRTVKQLAFEAQARKHWILDPKTKDWFSPDEFQEKYGRTPSIQDFLDQVQIRNPAEGIKPGFKAVQIVQA